MRIAGIQIECSENVEENIEKCFKFISIASEQEVDLIAFQELTFYPWFPESINEKNFSMAITVDSNVINKFKNIAKENNIAIVLAFFEKDLNFYNSAIFIDKDGELKGHYRKVHLPLIPNWEEKYYFKPGDFGFPVFDTSIGKIGIQLGWDIFFPEVARILTLKGAEIIISPTASAFSSQPRWVKVITSNALTNTVYICRINRVGKIGDIEFYGGSFCAGPDGALISEPAGSQEGIVLWDIDINELLEVRRLFPFLKDRIEKEYIEIAGKTFKNILED